MPQVGSPLLRPDDPRLLTGRGRYVDDLVLPRMVHVAFVRSVHAHALIAAVDLGAARRAPGVVALLTGEDAARLCKPCRGVLHHYQGMKTGALLPLAVERVRYVGEPVVAIAAGQPRVVDHVVGQVGVDERCARGHRLRGREHRRQRRPVDAHAGGGIVRLRARLGGDRHHRLADVAHALDGQRQQRAGLHALI
ncbi:MAG: hypothetical protein ACHQRO_14145, partial [Vicinamibacteria bacterium]